MKRCSVFRLLGAALLLWGGVPAQAHTPLSAEGQEQVAALLGTAVLAVWWLCYLVGSRRRPPSLRHSCCFHGAALLCVVAVLGPLDAWAETSAAAHMSQHMLMMQVIAPLWVLSRPLPQLHAGGGGLLLRLWQPLLRLAQRPMIAAYVHGLLIWFWHLPYFYVLALENPWWHLIEHACFILSAGLFWWAVLNGPPQQAAWALLATLFTLMHTGFLGGLLTFAREPLYGADRELADQQLAGLIMWVLGALPYLSAAAWIGRRWYLQLLRRMEA